MKNVVLLVAMLLVGCRGKDVSKNNLVSENMELANKVSELRDSISMLCVSDEPEAVQGVYVQLRTFENEIDEVGTPRKDVRVEVLAADGEASRYYLYDGTSIREIDRETAIVVRHADEEELCGIKLFQCECGKYHALHD